MNKNPISKLTVEAMRQYRLLFRLGPSAFFGLPDGDRVVLAAQDGGRKIVGPILDTRTGQLVSHGTLSQYRSPVQAIAAIVDVDGLQLTLNDNFLAVTSDASDPQAATDKVLSYVELLVQSLSTMHGERFFATLLSVEDDKGSPQTIRNRAQAIPLFQATLFNLEQLREHIAVAARWATNMDDAAKKALFYFEHACLLNEFAKTLPLMSHHASFSQALAFLQMFKALTSIIGDPSSDRDYQRRLKSLGLSKDFWTTKVKPLYNIRNEEDVAHYSHSFPEPGAYLAQFSQAAGVFREALVAHMNLAVDSPADGKPIH